MLLAACAQRRDVDFFPPEGRPKLIAACLALCSSCTVRQQCLDAAILEERDGSDHLIYGVRGGMTAAQRRRIHQGEPAGPVESVQVRQGQDGLSRIVTVLAAADEPLTAREVWRLVNVAEPHLSFDVVNRGLARRLAGVVDRERATRRTDRFRGIEFLYSIPPDRAAAYVVRAPDSIDQVLIEAPTKRRRRNVDQRVVAVLESAERPLTGVEVHRRVNGGAQLGEPRLMLSSVVTTLGKSKQLGISSVPAWHNGPTDINEHGRGTERLYGFGLQVGRAIGERVLEVLAMSLVPIDRREIAARVNDGARSDESAVPIKVIQRTLNIALAAGNVAREGAGGFGQDEFRYCYKADELEQPEAV